MTRFARSKGSKSSNERIPEASTPWNIMQEQLQDKMKNSKDSVKRAEFEAMRKENYEKFLKEEKAKGVTESWCQFEDESKPNKKVQSIVDDIKPEEATPTKLSKNQLKKLKRKNLPLSTTDKPVSTDDAGTKKNTKSSKPPKAKKAKDSDDESVFNEDDPEFLKWCDEPFDKETQDQYNALTAKLDEICDKEDQEVDAEEDSSNMKNKKKNRKRKSKDEVTVETTNAPPILDEHCNDGSKNETTISNEVSSENQAGQKKKRSKKAKKKIQDDENTVEQSNLTSSNEPPAKKKKNKQTNNTSANNTPTPTTPSNNKSNSKNKEHARRKPLALETTILIVNGERLEVTNYDGFPILLKDAERIQNLRKTLISKGIPKSEVDRTIKLERRRAEKNLARMKKKLCFHCRKGGHNLSECPELNKDGDNGMPSSGICFKCGSTEHTHFACRVVKAQEFKFAQCFICKEQGHISRQCPDNPRGLYPKGGGCRECGDVTHLKKDCPKIVQKREDDSLRLETLESNNVEAMETEVTATPVTKKPMTKHVKF